MKIFNDLLLKFERSDWSKHPEKGLIDTISEHHPQRYAGMAKDIPEGSKQSEFGRKDTSPVEQVVRRQG